MCLQLKRNAMFEYKVGTDLKPLNYFVEIIQKYTSDLNYAVWHLQEHKRYWNFFSGFINAPAVILIWWPITWRWDSLLPNAGLQSCRTQRYFKAVLTGNRQSTCHRITRVGVMASPTRWPYRQLSDRRRNGLEDPEYWWSLSPLEL